MARTREVDLQVVRRAGQRLTDDRALTYGERSGQHPVPRHRGHTPVTNVHDRRISDRIPQRVKADRLRGA